MGSPKWRGVALDGGARLGHQPDRAFRGRARGGDGRSAEEAHGRRQQLLDAPGHPPSGIVQDGGEGDVGLDRHKSEGSDDASVSHRDRETAAGDGGQDAELADLHGEEARAPFPGDEDGGAAVVAQRRGGHLKGPGAGADAPR